MCLRLPGDAPMVNGSRPDCPTPGGPLRTGFPDHDRQMTTFARSVDPPSGGYLGETTRTQHRYRWPPLCERVERTIGKFRITVGKSATGRSGVGCRRLYGGAVKENPRRSGGLPFTRGGGPVLLRLCCWRNALRLGLRLGRGAIGGADARRCLFRRIQAGLVHAR